jgi:hypothetical protein
MRERHVESEVKACTKEIRKAQVRVEAKVRRNKVWKIIFECIDPFKSW